MSKKNTEKDTRMQELELERGKLVEAIIEAIDLERWGNDPQTLRFGEFIDSEIKFIQDTMHSAVDDAEDPVPTAEQSRYRGRRKSLQVIRGHVTDARKATLGAIENARKYEAGEKEKAGEMFYKEAAWGLNYLEEACNRMEERKAEKVTA